MICVKVQRNTETDFVSSKMCGGRFDSKITGLKIGSCKVYNNKYHSLSLSKRLL